MSRLYDLEAALRKIRAHANGASRMTRRLSYIHELADAVLDGRPVDPEVKEPRDRALQWKNSNYPPEKTGEYVVRADAGDRSWILVGLWDGKRWIIVNTGDVANVRSYLTMRIPTERKV